MWRWTVDSTAIGEPRSACRCQLLAGDAQLAAGRRDELLRWSRTLARITAGAPAPSSAAGRAFQECLRRSLTAALAPVGAVHSTRDAAGRPVSSIGEIV